jgi:hypothetical protein
MRRIGLLLLLGGLVAALTAWGPGVVWATGLSSSVGTLAGSGGDEDDDGGDDDDGDDDEDDGEDDDDAVGGGDRAFCASAAPAPEPMRTTTQAVRVNRKRVAAVRVTGRANQDSTVTVKLRSKDKLLGSKSVDLAAGQSKLVKVKLSRKAFARIKLRDRIQAKVLVTAGAAAGPPVFGRCSVPRLLDFAFNASSGPLGENPMGTFFWESLPLSIEGQVTCLQVTGNRASVGGTITAGSPAAIGRGLAFTVVDNTPVAPDLISVISNAALLPAGPPANAPACGDPNQPRFSVTGDIVVQDNVGAGADEDDDDDEGDDGDDENDDD